MREPTKEDIDALVGPATPHFAPQLRARVEELVLQLPEGHPVKKYAREKIELLERLAFASSKAEEGPREPRSRPGWEELAEHGARARTAARSEMNLESGRSVVVTGGTRGIGKTIALRLASEGATRVVLGYMRNDEAAEAAAEEVRQAGAEPVLVRGNVASEKVIAELASHGPYAVVVHNAATGVIKPALETEDKHWDWTLNANARALLSLARACAPDMESGSTIVAISSLGAQRVLENYVLVGTSKAALESVVRYLAVELAPRGIRVNAVSAGVVETEALDHFPNREEMLRAGKTRTPAGRLVEPDDIAGAVAFLCSPDAQMVRGHTLIVDGGFSLLA